MSSALSLEMTIDARWHSMEIYELGLALVIRIRYLLKREWLRRIDADMAARVIAEAPRSR